jgi:transcriptional regulator GlxA family with amidase domain
MASEWHRLAEPSNSLTQSEARVRDVGVACDFKTPQHFARMFRRICGASTTVYRYKVLLQSHWAYGPS